MAEQLQELLERINREGVEKAEQRAAEIISAAETEAQRILAAAEKGAEERTKNAEAAAARFQATGEKSLEQSFRNVLLSLREEVQRYFDRILLTTTRQTLTPETLTQAILDLIGRCAEQITGAEVKLLLSPEDAEKMAGELIARFQAQAATGIQIQPIAGIDAGFTISFDGGKSAYDFTDQGLRDLITTYLSPHLQQILNGQ